jgi:alpha-1,3-mannosyl-glycoprotein beta-1,2-N-acetylglucosaminyltransferase
MPTVQNPGNPNYYAIAQHYKFGFEQVFKSNPLFKRVIVLEEDIEIAPDFFDYFSALAPVLDSDPKLYCVSAWNDNGLRDFVKDPEALYRSDFFPGLGWMMTRKLWDEIHDDWPLGFWDDWLRESTVRKGRACIRPEISRTYTFGASGVSNVCLIAHLLTLVGTILWTIFTTHQTKFRTSPMARKRFIVLAKRCIRCQFDKNGWWSALYTR